MVGIHIVSISVPIKHMKLTYLINVRNVLMLMLQTGDAKGVMRVKILIVSINVYTTKTKLTYVIDVEAA